VRTLTLTGLACAAIVLAGLGFAGGGANASPRWYAPASPWNTPIPHDARATPNSHQLVGKLIATRKAINVNTVDWTPPVYFARRGTPRASVTVGDGQERDRIDVPIPRGARPSLDRAGTDPPPTRGDNYLVVIDRAKGCEYDFWKMHRDADGWYAVNQATFRLDGSGVHEPGAVRASSFALGAGLLRPVDFGSEGIRHALGWAIPHTVIGSRHVQPAQSSDGRVTNGIPMGTLFQLDPTLELDTFRPRLAPWQKTIARAMQRYGVYVFDTAHDAIALTAQSEISGARYPFPRYSQLPHALIARMRTVRPPTQRPRLDSRSTTGCSQRRPAP
jgi:hypothetical protein